VLAYLSATPHRVAISNSRPHRRRRDRRNVQLQGLTGSRDPGRYKTMTLKPDEFIAAYSSTSCQMGSTGSGLRPDSSGTNDSDMHRARELSLPVTPGHTSRPAARSQSSDSNAASQNKPTHPCPGCGGRMNIIETFKARLDAAIPTAAANRDQHRYLVITFPASQIKNTDRSRWSSTRHGGARANPRWRSQRGHRSPWLKADSRSCGGHLARQRRQPAHSSALVVVTQLCRAKIPIAPAAPSPATSRGFVH